MICLNCGKDIGMGNKFCPNCGKPTTIADKENVGTIIVKRENKFVGSLINFDVFIDGEKVGKLGNGKTLTYDMPLGSYDVKLSAPGNNVVREVNLTEKNRTVEITIVCKMGMVTGKPYVKSIEYK